MTYVIDKVAHIKQPSPNLCWSTCAKMLFQHKIRQLPTAVITPIDKKQSFGLSVFAKEAGLTCAQIKAAQLSTETIENMLRQYGPLIATVGMYSRSPHVPDHAILIVGVDASNIYYDDPAKEKGAAKHKMKIAELKRIFNVWPCSLLYLQ